LICLWEVIEDAALLEAPRILLWRRYGLRVGRRRIVLRDRSVIGGRRRRFPKRRLEVFRMGPDSTVPWRDIVAQAKVDGGTQVAVFREALVPDASHQLGPDKAYRLQLCRERVAKRAVAGRV